MPKSIRWRLQAWYAGVLLAVIGGFALVLHQSVRQARFRDLDGRLVADARYLEATLRSFPPHLLNTRDEGPPQLLDGPGRRPPRRYPPLPPPGRSRARLLFDLDLTGPDVSRGPPRPPRDPPYFGVWRADGSLLKGSGLSDAVIRPDPTDTPPGNAPRLSRRGDAREVVLRGPGETQILVGKSARQENEELTVFAWQLAGAGSLALAFGLVGGRWISGQIVRPLATISTTASAISADNLSRRLAETDVDVELAELVGVLNAMFARLEAAFERQTRFTADASHELRTPLAIIRSQAELTLSRPRAPEEYQAAIASCLRAAGRMTDLVDALLTLARADAAKLELARQPLEWDQLVADCIESVRPLIEEKKLALSADLPPVHIVGDPARIAQVVTNLLTNAIHYNRAGGELRVSLAANHATATLSVTDTGCGIPEPARSRVFERFFRVAEDRSRKSGGYGLGLAICKSIVQAHGGSVGFESEVDRGSTFWVRLPSGPT